jgi:hypothetical protein
MRQVTLCSYSYGWQVRGRVREVRAETSAAGTAVRACVEDAGRALGEAAEAIVRRVAASQEEHRSAVAEARSELRLARGVSQGVRPRPSPPRTLQYY